MASRDSSEFTVGITGLSPDTEYFVRTYATTVEGTTYGNEVSFTTQAVSDPGSGNSSKIYWLQSFNDDSYDILSIDGDGDKPETIFQGLSGDGYIHDVYNLFYVPDAQTFFFLETREREQEDYYKQFIRSLDKVIVTSKDSSSINVLNASGSRLFWVEEDEADMVEVIRSSNLDGSDKTNLYVSEKGQYLEYITYNENTDQIFSYMNYPDYGIFKINGDGTGYTKIPIPDEESIFSLATAGDKLYWAQDIYVGSEQKSVIRSTNLDGSSITDLFVQEEYENAFDIYELVVGPVNEKIVFIFEEYDKQGYDILASHIASVNFDGTELTILYSLDADDGYLMTVATSQAVN